MDSIFKAISTKNYQIKSSEIISDGLIPVINQGKDYISGYSNDISKSYKDFPVILFGDHTTNLKYVDFEFIIGGDGVKILNLKDTANNKYLFHALNHYNVAQEGYKRHYSLLKKVKLPIPDINIQFKVQNIIDSFDIKINLLNSEIKQLQFYKKYLLQNMFI